VAFKKASFMTDPSLPPETPDVAEIAGFLRRFADLMSNGYNATYLHRAADVLEGLTARVTAASDEENLWRYKYETVTRHADALEAECDTLKRDVEGHMEIAASILGERDALKAALQERETEITELEASLSRERSDAATTSDQREEILAGLRAAFDRERETPARRTGPASPIVRARTRRTQGYHREGRTEPRRTPSGPRSRTDRDAGPLKGERRRTCSTSHRFSPRAR
jgi:hypothetical protein